MAKKPVVLIAEDSPVNRSILRKILGDDYILAEATDGIAAFRMIKEMHDELAAVVMDLRMPGMNGEEILSALAELQYKDIPILVATGAEEADIEKQCLKLGAWDFVTKPYDAELLKLRLQNIIGRKQGKLLKQIRIISQRDHLTGIYNRDYFLEQTQKMLRKYPDKTFALVRMDIDRFRLYNASFGQKAGDELLCRFAESIDRDAKELSLCTYGRIESDVFCLCVPYTSDGLRESVQAASLGARGLCKNYRLELSFGIYILPDNEMNIEEAYSYASEASKKCKDRFDITYVIYDESMYQKQMSEQSIVNDMENAIAEGQFHVYLQPKYSLTTNAPCGAEALVRWMHPEKGLVSPGDFIPVFERNGFIDQLDHYMWEQVCILLHKWIDNEGKADPISVNVSRISLYNPQIVKDLVGIADKYHVPHELLNLEITESAYMSNPELMKTVIEQLRSNGFIILMDDFGSGYSSLNTLKDIEMDILKIDMKFLPNGQNNVKSEKILASITRMAGWLGMSVVVEGVETQGQRDFLVSIGCGYVQGYYFAKPMPVEEYEELVYGNAQISDPTLEEEETDLADIEAIWSADTRMGTLLKSISVPFAILEYSPSGIDVVRMNAEYIKVFGEERSGVVALAPEEYNKLHIAIAEASDEMQSACDCLYVLHNGEFRWYHIHVQKMRSIGKSTLLSATFTNITSERMLENELSGMLSAIRKPKGLKAGMLIVDDSEASREILRNLFREEYLIYTASNGKEALEQLKKLCDKVAIILLDLMMPVMSGQEFLAQKNSMEGAADIPVVVISSDQREELQINMLQSGVNDYVTKPFVPQAVIKRVKNVLEYSSRFRTLVREYNAANIAGNQTRISTMNQDYTILDINIMIEFLSRIFDLVRLVDPGEMKVIKVNDDGSCERSDYSCFKIWERNERCQNCTSLCAFRNRQMVSKYEFIKQDIFYVISQPIRIEMRPGVYMECVLEVASHISDHLMMPENQEHSVEHLLEDTYKKIYTDTLTGAYNRRYYDEMKFLRYDSSALVSEKVALILMDMCNFKKINDIYGHIEGDTILAQVSKVLKRQIRSTDSVIRYGGDEFVVVMIECDENQITSTIDRLNHAVESVTYGGEAMLHVKADFGYAYTEEFQQNARFLKKLFCQADERMYAHKELRIGKDKL